MTLALDEAAAAPSNLGTGWWAGGPTLAEWCALPGAPTPAPGLVGWAGRRLSRRRAAHGLGTSGPPPAGPWSWS